MGNLIHCRWWKAVEWAVEKGADLSYNSRIKFSPLRVALEVSSNLPLEIMRKLIHPSTISNPFCLANVTPLHLSALRRNHAEMDLLLDHGADTSIRTGSGMTAFDVYVQSIRYQDAAWFSDVDHSILFRLVPRHTGIPVESVFCMIVNPAIHLQINIGSFIRKYLNALKSDHAGYGYTVQFDLHSQEITLSTKSRGDGPHNYRFSFLKERAPTFFDRMRWAIDMLWDLGIRPSSYISYHSPDHSTSHSQSLGLALWGSHSTSIDERSKKLMESFESKWFEHNSSVVSLQLQCVHVIRAALMPVTELRLQQLQTIPEPIRNMIHLADIF